MKWVLLLLSLFVLIIVLIILDSKDAWECEMMEGKHRPKEKDYL